MTQKQIELDRLLIKFVELGQIKVIKKLLKLGADVDAWHGLSLRHAANDNNVEVFKLLLLNNKSEYVISFLSAWRSMYTQEIQKILISWNKRYFENILNKPKVF